MVEQKICCTFAKNKKYSMSEEIKFIYFLDGEEISREAINWESNINVKVQLNKVYITSISSLIE